MISSATFDCWNGTTSETNFVEKTGCVELRRDVCPISISFLIDPATPHLHCRIRSPRCWTIFIEMAHSILFYGADSDQPTHFPWYWPNSASSTVVWYQMAGWGVNFLLQLNWYRVHPIRCVSSNRAESQETIQVLPFNYQGGQIEQNGSLVIGQDEIGKWNSIIHASSHHREPPATWYKCS